MAYTAFNRELNRQFLSGAIKYPHEVMAEIGSELTEKDFDPEANRVVFSSLQSCLASGGPYSELVLIDRMNSMGIKIGGALEPAVYIGSLLGLAVSAKAAIAIAKQIKKVSVRRELHEAARKVQLAIEEDATSGEPMKSSELVSKATGVFNEKVNVLGGSGEDGPIDLLGGMEEYIESLGFDSDEIGVIPPYPLYHELWGSFSPGDLSVYCARPKGAKSTFLMNMLEQCVMQDPNVMCLMLDTELETKRVMRRMAASMANVNEYIIKNGKWKEDPVTAGVVRAALTRAKALTQRLNHIYVGGKNTNEILSLCRRWFHKNNLGTNGKKALICLDYIKLGSVELQNLGSMKDYQKVGANVDLFKQLATELQCHIVTAAQTNRSNEGRDVGTRRSDGAVIGLSDFISQYASSIFLLERLTIEQIATFGSLDCTHTLSCVYARNLGPKGSQPLVKYKDDRGKDRWMDDFIFYRIRNFRVEELISFREAVERNQSLKIPVQGAGHSAADLL